LGAFIRPPFPLFCAIAFPSLQKSSTQAGAQFCFRSISGFQSIKISFIEKIKNLQRRSESKLNINLGFISFFLPPNYDNFAVQYM
jgi:hypothetical protein